MATAGGSAQPPRCHQYPLRVSFVELLFDVVFVFAFTRLSERVVTDLSWRGFYATSVLLLAMWWVWYRMACTSQRWRIVWMPTKTEAKTAPRSGRPRAVRRPSAGCRAWWR